MWLGHLRHCKIFNQVLAAHGDQQVQVLLAEGTSLMQETRNLVEPEVVKFASHYLSIMQMACNGINKDRVAVYCRREMHVLRAGVTAARERSPVIH